MDFMTDNRGFEYSIFVVIIISTIHLMIDTPLVDPDSNKAKILFKVDFVLTVIFLLEAVIKILIFGIVGKRSYFKDFWNILDFVVVVISVRIFC